jgi:glutaredoxin 3
LLKSLESTIFVEASIVDLDLMADNDGPLIQQELLQRTGQRTVPNVFIGTKHIGGNSDFQQLVAEGKLTELLNDMMKLRTTVAQDL